MRIVRGGISMADRPEESYTARLRRSALRLIHGPGGPVCCAECGESEEPELLHIHHEYAPGERNGNQWREIHGNGGAALYRYILRPGVEKPRLILLCPNCHARTHNNAKITKNPKNLQSNLSSLHSYAPNLDPGHPRGD